MNAECWHSLAAGPQLSTDASADRGGLSWPEGLPSPLFPSQYLLWRPWGVLWALMGGKGRDLHSKPCQASL